MIQSSTHAFGQKCDIISINCATHWHLFSDFSPFHSLVEEKVKQWSIKGLTMVQWINLNQNKRSVLAHWYSVLWEKTDPILLLLVMAGRGAGWQTKYGWILNFLNSQQVKLFRLILCLLSLQCYYCNSVRTAFQSTFIK